MEVFIKLDIKVRNTSLILIVIAVLILTIWTILFLLCPKRELYYLLYVGVALFLAGILVLTRIQFVLWAEKRVQRSSSITSIK